MYNLAAIQGIAISPRTPCAELGDSVCVFLITLHYLVGKFMVVSAGNEVY